jgi:hypothetical protein
LTDLELMACQHLDVCIESGEIKGDTALAIRKLFAVFKERDQLREKLNLATQNFYGIVDALEFYRTWENKTKTAWSENYNRTVLSIDYPGPSKANEALAKIRGDNAKS